MWSLTKNPGNSQLPLLRKHLVSIGQEKMTKCCLTCIEDLLSIWIDGWRNHSFEMRWIRPSDRHYCIIVVARRSLWFVEKEPFKIYHFCWGDSQFLVFLLEKELLTNLSTSFSKFWSAPGGWIMLQNIHLMQAWLKDLERALEVIEEFVHDDARHTNRTYSKQFFVVIASNIVFGRTIFFMALRRIHRY